MISTKELQARWHFPNPEYRKYCDRMADEITQLAGHLDAGSYQLIKLIGDFDDNEGWGGDGIKSCAHWLNLFCGMNLGAARERVRVARVLPDLPNISAAFREGRVSYSKVRAMTRIATAKNEDALLNTALYGTASHVEMQVRLYRRVKRIEALHDENIRHAQRELSWFTDDDGSLVLKGRFGPEQGAVIKKAMEAAMDELFEEHKQVPEVVTADLEKYKVQDDYVPAPIAWRRADALEQVAEGFLASPESERSGGYRCLVNIHTDMDTLREDGEVAESELEDHVHVSAETSRRMACDSSRVDWLDDDRGNPLNIGRKSRTIPPAIRRALRRRDRGCRFPGCTCSRFTDAHHVKHWADGGETSMHNLVTLCRNHHRLVHEGGYGVHISAVHINPAHIDPGQAIHFTMPNGTRLPEGPLGRFRGNVTELETLNRKNGVDITPKTARGGWYGDHMDKNMAVEALLKRE